MTFLLFIISFRQRPCASIEVSSKKCPPFGSTHLYKIAILDLKKLGYHVNSPLENCEWIDSISEARFFKTPPNHEL